MSPLFNRRRLLKLGAIGIGGSVGVAGPAAASTQEDEAGVDREDFVRAVLSEVDRRAESGEYSVRNLEALGIDPEASRDSNGGSTSVSTQSIPDLPGVPSLPTSFPFTFCVQPPWFLPIDDVCTSVTDPIPTEVECASNPVSQVSISIASGGNVWTSDDEIGGDVSWSADIWVGFSENCAYVGVGGACAPVGCYAWPTVTEVTMGSVEKVVDIAEDIADVIDDEIRLPGPARDVLVIVLAIIIVIAIALPPTGVPG